MTNSEQEKNTTKSGSKTLVVYYSAQNHTKAVAEKIAQNLNADIFEIEPEEKYSEEDLNWTNRNSRVSKEHDDESLRDIKLKKDTVDNWSDYDTVLIGYPIWWGIAAWPVDTFVKANDLSGKTIKPFATNAGWIGRTFIEIKKLCPNSKVEDGLNILYDAGDYRTRKLITSLDEIDNWINTL